MFHIMHTVNVKKQPGKKPRQFLSKPFRSVSNDISPFNVLQHFNLFYASFRADDKYVKFRFVVIENGIESVHRNGMVFKIKFPFANILNLMEMQDSNSGLHVDGNH